MPRTPARTSSLLFTLVSIGSAAGLGACSTQESDSVVSAETSHVIWKSDGTGQIELPANVPCHFDATYDLDVHAGTLAWSFCTFSGTDFSDPGAYVPVIGSRTLTNDEKSQATAAASAVKVSSGTLCRGADLEGRSLEVDDTAGSVTYGDDFYACQMQYQRYVVFEQLANLGDVLRGMAHSP